MPQSLAKNLIHLVFSTKRREPLLDEPVWEPLYGHAVGVLREVDSPSLAIGAWFDHMHVLFALSRTHTLADVVMHLKRATSMWVKTQGPRYRSFYWQNGYGAFSIGQSAVDGVKTYIASQAEHHREQDFQAEFRGLLRRYEIDFDERYVWD